MGVPCLVIGKSGSGKTYSLKNCDPDKFGVISVEKGRLPFKSKIKVARIPKSLKNPDGTEVSSYSALNRARYAWLTQVIRGSKGLKSIVIDDSQYLLVNEMFDRSSEKGYDKFTDIAKNFRDLVHFVNEAAPDDMIVYFLHHSETGADGREKCKTIGKMLEEKLVIEGMFDVVIYCADHKFYTQANEISSAKTPEGMFEDLEIPNDLALVDQAIREYWNLNEEESES